MEQQSFHLYRHQRVQAQSWWYEYYCEVYPSPASGLSYF